MGSIAFTKYVDITSGVGGSTQVARRELIGRIFTTNELVPTDTVLEFTELEDVASYFGTASEEYKRSSFYFGFVSKRTTQAQKISFARWADVDTAPQAFGESLTQDLTVWQNITDGSVTVNLAAITEDIVGVSFAAAVSLADVATALESAIQSANVDPLFASATVTYDAVGKRFNLVGGSTGVAYINIIDGATGTNIGQLLGWTTNDAILSNGVVAQSVTDILTTSTSITNNFGSFLFMPELDLPQTKEASTWTKAQNVRFMFVYDVLDTDTQTYFDELGDFGGTAQMLRPDSLPDEYHEMPPMILLASTDYSLRNATKNYMYQQFVLTPSVADTLTSNELDAIRTNYYGLTQSAGKTVEFFQRGKMFGLAVDPAAMNVYANEIWFKDAAGVAIMNLLLAVEAVPANESGAAQVRATLQDVIDEALFNAVISVGKTLSSIQKAYILQVTGDENAWLQIQQIGYHLSVVIVEDPQEPGEYVAKYVLLYSKSDVVNRVEGIHTLI